MYGHKNLIQFSIKGTIDYLVAGNKIYKKL